MVSIRAVDGVRRRKKISESAFFVKEFLNTNRKTIGPIERIFTAQEMIMGQKLSAKDWADYADNNRRLADIAEEQGNIMLARQLAVLARRADHQCAPKPH